MYYSFNSEMGSSMKESKCSRCFGILCNPLQQHISVAAKETLHIFVQESYGKTNDFNGSTNTYLCVILWTLWNFM